MSVIEAGKGIVATVDVSRAKPQSLFFNDDDHILIYASRATKLFAGYESVQAFVYNIANGSLMSVAEKENRVRFFPESVGRKFGDVGDTGRIYSGARVGERGDALPYSLVDLNLDKAQFTVVENGTPSTRDWVVDSAGVVLGREDYNEDNNVYSIYTKHDGSWKKLYEKVSEQQPIDLIGYFTDGSGLAIVIDTIGQETKTFRRLDWNGKLSEPLFAGSGREISSLVTGRNKEILGAAFAGLKPEYEFLDAGLTAALKDLAARYPRDAVRLAGWTKDKSKLVIAISGGATAPAYFLYDPAQKSAGRISRQYLRIDDGDIQPVEMTSYKARDGLSIPTLITRPANRTGGKLPLIVMPHGGPESHDELGFDFFAQYFASRGHIVLQPNFRGSDGFGSKLRDAGFGQWGRKMQDDITDGVSSLIASGEVDPSRVCIIGASYGGYAALAGGAFTPDVYKCVAAIAPVADILDFFDHRIRQYGSQDSVIAYWELLLGDRKNNKSELQAISPTNNAEKFKAPVLLIHGADDTNVPFSQSAKMEAALKKAGKNVRLVKLLKEDHNLSNSETRLQALQEIDRFVAETIGRND